MEDAVEELLLGVGGGDTSVARMGRLAAAFAAAGGPEAPLLRELARFQERNAERGLHRWCQGQPWRRLLPRDLYQFPMSKLGLKGDYGQVADSQHWCPSALQQEPKN
jgi:hypothetical protein